MLTPLLAFRFFVDLFSELGQQKLNVKIHLFSSPHPAHHNAYTVQNIPTQFSVGEQTTLIKYETSNYSCYLKKSPLIFTLEVVSAPKPSGVKLSISCLTASWKEPGYHIISLPKTSEVKKPRTRRRIGNSHGWVPCVIHTYLPPDVIRYQSHPMATVTFWWCVYADSSLSFLKVKGIGITLSFCMQHKNKQENPCKHQKIMLVHLIISLSGHVISCLTFRLTAKTTSTVVTTSARKNGGVSFTHNSLSELQGQNPREKSTWRVTGGFWTYGWNIVIEVIF